MSVNTSRNKEMTVTYDVQEILEVALTFYKINKQIKASFNQAELLDHYLISVPTRSEQCWTDPPRLTWTKVLNPAHTPIIKDTAAYKTGASFLYSQ